MGAVLGPHLSGWATAVCVVIMPQASGKGSPGSTFKADGTRHCEKGLCCSCMGHACFLLNRVHAKCLVCGLFVASIASTRNTSILCTRTISAGCLGWGELMEF